MRFKIYIIKYYELTFGYFICIPESLYYIHIARRLLCTISSQSIVTNTDALYLGVCCVLSHVWLFATPWTAASRGDSPGKNTGMGCHAFLQEIFPTKGSNSDLPHCRHILYHLSHQGSPRILEWVVFPFSRGSFRPRN